MIRPFLHRPTRSRRAFARREVVCADRRRIERFPVRFLGPLSTDAVFPLRTELEGTFPDVSVGSYLNFETKELVMRFLGSDPKRADVVVEVVRRRSAQLGMTGERR
jgi:hypothetical protein